jgi:CHAT domain-containing protein/Tfp pilus assembly protein PilF
LRRLYFCDSDGRAKEVPDKKILRVFSFLLVPGLVPIIALSTAAKGRLSSSDLEAKMREGNALREQGEFYSALTALEEALRLAELCADGKAQVACLTGLGTLSWDIGKIKDSDQLYRRALSLGRNLGLKKDEERCAAYVKICECYVRGKEACASGRHRESISQFSMAIGLARKLDSPEHEVKCLRQMSLNYHQSRAYSVFLALNKRALGIAHKLNHKKESGRCLNNIGVYLYETNSYSQALVYFEEALSEIRQTQENQLDLSACLNNTGLIFKELGDYSKAILLFEEALEIDRGLKDEEGISIDLNNLGSTFHSKSKNQNTEIDLVYSWDFFMSSLEMVQGGKNKKLLVNILNNIAMAYGSLGRYPLSMRYFRLALREAELTTSDYESCNIHCNIGYMQARLGYYEQAYKSFCRALALASKVERKEVQWETYLGLGLCLEKMHEENRALSSYRNAIKIVELVRERISLDEYKVGFVRDKMRAYEALIDLLFDLREKEQTTRYDAEIFEVVEKAKARSFLEEMERSDRSNLAPSDPRYRTEEASLSKKISSTIFELVRRDLDENQRRKLLGRLESQEDEYTSLINRRNTEAAENSGIAAPQVISIDKLGKQYLNGKSAILEYYLGEERSFGILLSKNTLVLKSLPSRAEIESSLKGYLKMLSTPPQGGFRGIPAARRIYRELVHPFQEAISQDVSHLIFIPDGILHCLPFEALAREDPKTGEPRFLIEFFEISYAPSATSFAYLMEKEKGIQFRKSLLAVGAPAFLSAKNRSFGGREKHGDVLRDIYLSDGFELTALPYSKREVRQVARCFPRSEVEVLTESQAKEENIKAKALDEYRFIHFACHGFLDEKTPARSALVLTLDEDPNEDGFLQAREIAKLGVKADLVVLSACQTGKGRLENGEGVLGLPRSFFYAGARSTISSLWKIDDKSTSEVMPEFYRCLADGQNKAQALRLAKIKMLRSRFAHPFYWAAFILNGKYL